jgi:hypothetical protein
LKDVESRCMAGTFKLIESYGGLPMHGGEECLPRSSSGRRR